LPHLKDIHDDQPILINGQTLRIKMMENEETINLRQADDVAFSVMPLFHKLFNNRFHRIGLLVVFTKKQKYVFYFPPRNDRVAEELSSVLMGS
jgi:hypothetical protein